MVAWYTPGVGFRRAGVPYEYRENAIGSVMQVTDNQGLVRNRYEYDAYGYTYTLQQAMTNPHKFGGKHGYYTDGDSGMQLLGHRYYLPSLGRFLTQDPLGHGAGLNLYQYADQNPLVNIDPDGEQGVGVLSGGLALSGAGAGSSAAGAALGSNPIGWSIAGIAAATAGAYYTSNYFASRYYDVSGLSSPRLGDGLSVKSPTHTGNGHGGDWGMPHFNPNDPNDLSKLAFKLTFFTGLAQQAIRNGSQRFAAITYTYWGQIQTMYLNASGKMTMVQGNTVVNGWTFGSADAVRNFFSSGPGGRVVAPAAVDAAIKRVGLK